MIDMLSSDEFITILIEAETQESIAVGFLATETDNKLDYNYETLSKKIANIIDDMNNESKDETYKIGSLPISFTR